MATTTTTIAIADVASEADVADTGFGGSTTRMYDLLPEGVADLTTHRTKALEASMKHLKRRIPPIVDADIADPTDLRDAVCYHALAQLYEDAMSSADLGDAFRKKAEWWRSRWESEIAALNPTIGDDERGPPGSQIVVTRR